MCGGLAAVHRNCERRADLGHSAVAHATDSIRKHTYRDAFDRIEIDSGSATHRIIARLKDDFASEAADRGRARCDQSATESGNCRITREDDDGSAANLGRFAPPEFAAQWGAHVAAAADRNDWRSPHSSGSSMGCCS